MKIKLKFKPESAAEVAILADVLGQIAVKTVTKEPVAAAQQPKQQEVTKPTPPPPQKPTAPPPPPAPVKQPEAPKMEAVKAEPPVEQPAEQAGGEQPITVDNLRLLTQKVIDKGLKVNVKSILDGLGAATVSLLKPEHYEKYKAELEKLLA